LKQKSPKIDRARYEAFGGIISCTNPPFLVWVDKEYMQQAGYPYSELWDKEDPGYLSAPTEVHFAVTNRCSQGCNGCYTSSNSASPKDELNTDQLKTVFLILRDMGVFHVALGGGEAFERPDFSEIVTYCREIGLMPNLTTNGQKIGTREIEICKIMGQVNVSMDGIDSNYSINGRQGSFKKADDSIQKLKKAGVSVGINCTVSVKNFDLLESVISYGSDRGLNEIEFLKYKPFGRGTSNYLDFALNQEMIKSFYPFLQKMSDKYGIELKIDCSFIPAMVYHKPPVDELQRLAVTGCDGGNLLLGVKSNGVFSGCSFVSNNEFIGEIEKLWHTSDHLSAFRKWVDNAPEPCKSCEYLKICQGGCRANSLFLTGKFETPDPECPYVYDYENL